MVVDEHQVEVGAGHHLLPAGLAQLVPDKFVESWLPPDLGAKIPKIFQWPLVVATDPSVWAYNTAVYQSCPVSNLWELTEPKWKGKVAIYDYYLPVIGMAALAIGKKTADLTEADLPALKAELLKMKANAKLVGEVTASQTALATGEVDILVGGGEWVTAGSTLN